jgi:hypothetical protein
MMRFTRLSLCLLFFLLVGSSKVAGQEGFTKFMAGPHGDETRIVVALTHVTDEGYKLQSLIIDLAPLKKGSEPSSFHVDLTSTIRSLATGAKQQKIFIFQWDNTGDLDVKCNGKYEKHQTNASIDKIIEITKAVIKIIPNNLKEPKDLKLPSELEASIAAIMDGMKPEDLPCLRELN